MKHVSQLMPLSNTIKSICHFCGAEKPRRKPNGDWYEPRENACSCAESKKFYELWNHEQQVKAQAEKTAAQEQARIRLGIPRRFLFAEHAKADKFAKAVLEGKTLYITGNVGTGKTHLAAAIIKELQQKKIKSFEFVSSVGLIRLFEDCMRENRSEGVLLNRLVGRQVLVIDDLGKERVTAWTFERLFELFDRRYNAVKPSIITSNFSLSALAGRLVDKGCSVENAQALVSRLKQTSLTVELSGHDRRIA